MKRNPHFVINMKEDGNDTQVIYSRKKVFIQVARNSVIWQNI